MSDTLMNFVQIIVASALITLVLLQTRGSGFGAALGGGGGGGGGGFRTRRGIERTLFQSTIILTILFIFVSFLAVTSN